MVRYHSKKKKLIHENIEIDLLERLERVAQHFEELTKFSCKLSTYSGREWKNSIDSTPDNEYSFR